MVDDHWFEYLNQFNWSVTKGGNSFYARRNIGGSFIQMHREILGLTDPKIFGEHEDHNGLNNKEGNLRRATNSQNCANRKPRGISKYMGVCWNKKDKKWQVYVVKNSQRYYVGQFDDEVEAAKAYDKKAIELHGVFANLNFKQ